MNDLSGGLKFAQIGFSAPLDLTTLRPVVHAQALKLPRTNPLRYPKLAGDPTSIPQPLRALPIASPTGWFRRSVQFERTTYVGGGNGRGLPVTLTPTAAGGSVRSSDTLSATKSASPNTARVAVILRIISSEASGGSRNRTSRCGFGDHRVTDTLIPRSGES